MLHPHASAKPQARRNVQAINATATDLSACKARGHRTPNDPGKAAQWDAVCAVALIGRTVAGASAQNHLRPHLRSVRPCPDEPWTRPRASLPVAATAAAPKTNSDPGSYGLQTGHRRSTIAATHSLGRGMPPPPQGPAQR